MKELDYEERLARADRAVRAADQDLRNAVQLLSSGATPRLAQIGAAAMAVGVVGAFLLRRGRRSNSRFSKAIDYSVLLPLAASVIPRVVAMMSNRPPAYRAPGAGSSYARARARTP
ncbi:MAG: hypothetical protein M9885_00570 [Burkholderiaceae bacterium]|nr:hypothetical protein [Burkholderiaceae bacterium]